MKSIARKKLESGRAKVKIIALFVGTIFVITSLVLLLTNFNSIKQPLDPEIIKSMEYKQVQSGDENIDGNDYVKFDAFFLRDINNDGKAEGIRGSTRAIGEADTLYMELKVNTKGSLQEGKITINEGNIYFQTAIAKDNEIIKNYISNNTKVIELATINSGTQKLIEGSVRSGDYSLPSQKYIALGNNTKKYSAVNSVTLTGFYVSDTGERSKIEKKVDFNVDWHGTMQAVIDGKENINQKKGNANLIQDKQNGQMRVSFDFYSKETKNELLLSEANIKATIPSFKGYEPINAVIKGNNVTSTYDKNTKILTAVKTAKTNEEGRITSQAYDEIDDEDKINNWYIEITYPIIAYQALNGNAYSYKLPVGVFYKGFNHNDYTNPYISNTAQEIIVVNYSKPEGEVAIFEVEIGSGKSGKSDSSFISKEKPLRIYNKLSVKESEDYYIVGWHGFAGKTSGQTMTMKETPNGSSKTVDHFVKKDETEDRMDNITSNVGIYFVNAESLLGKDGYINVYNDDTGELIEKFDVNNWNDYDSESPYMYSNPIEHIKVETSNVNDNSSIYVYHIKEINDNEVVNKYTKANFDNLSYIRSNLVGYIGSTQINTDTKTAIYEAPVSKATLSIGYNTISTQKVEKNTFSIDVDVEKNMNLANWEDGSFLLKLPKEIIDFEITNIECSGTEVEIVNYEKYEENGIIYVKIITSGMTKNRFSIAMDVEMSADPRKLSTEVEVELYATNENCNEYYESTQDVYDVNGNANINELVGTSRANLSLISPNSLLTGQYASEFDNTGKMAIAPQVAVVDKTIQSAKISAFVTNNYTNVIREVKVLGKIPTIGNRYGLDGDDLGSTYDTILTGSITLQSTLEGKATVYYSTEVNPTENIKDNNNHWTTSVSDWSSIKSYLIDFGNNSIPKNERYEFSYKVNFPKGLDYNSVSYSHHTVFFSLETDEGTYSTSTEPNKLGLVIAKLYNLQITKTQKNSSKLVPGATYMAIAEGEEKGITGMTNEDGIAILKDLYAEKKYTITEIKSSKNYELNTDEIEITTSVSETGELTVTKQRGTTKQGPTVSRLEDGTYQIAMGLEDEVKANIAITKIDKSSNSILSNILFRIKGYGMPENGQEVYTNKEGKFELIGLSLNQEYTLEEVTAEGYYLTTTKFRLTKSDTSYNINITSGNENIKENSVSIENEIPTINLTVQNEKIPTYELIIKKVKKNDEENKGLDGARYSLTSEDTKETKYYITDTSGEIHITGLYNYVNGKYITGDYTLKELRAPAGYAITGEEVKFRVTLTNGVMSITITNETNLKSVKSHTITDNTVNLVLQDSPIFSITKIDKETHNPIQGAKFTIQKIDTNKKILGYAQDPDGKYVGTQDASRRYIVTTDENGQITTPLAGGFYQITEIEAPEGYVLPTTDDEKIHYFTIEGFEDLKINYIEDLIKFSKDSTYYSTGKVTSLARDLDFNDPKSYRDPDDSTTYPDYNGDGNPQGIKDELTDKTGRGFIRSSNTFGGIFLGNDHCIKNIYINNQTGVTPNYGFFGIISSSGKVSNLGITGEYVYNSTSSNTVYMGGFVNSNSGTIENCYSGININVNTSSSVYVGGFAYIPGNLINCHNEGNINVTVETGFTCVGGITPSNNVSGCYNEGNITVESKGDTRVGGITGGGTVEKCYNTGKIVAHTSYVNPQDNRVGLYVGGISGLLYQDVNSNVIQKISNCENRGEVQGGMTINTSTTLASIGGIAGYINNGTVENCSNEAKITANGINQEAAGGISGYLYGDNGKVINCFNTGEINATSSNNYARAGGIIGYTFTDTVQKNIIANCYNTGNITGSSGHSVSGKIGGYVGGIIGTQSENILINAYNAGIVKGIATGVSAGTVGGIIGDQKGEIYNSYNTAQIIYQGNNENGAVGGIAGYVRNGSIAKNCYTTGSVSGTGKYWIGAAVAYAFSGYSSSNIYYMTGTASSGCGYGSASTTVKTSTDMSSTSFVTELNDQRSSIDSYLTSNSIDSKTLEWVAGNPYPTMNMNINVDTNVSSTEESTITTATEIEIPNTAKTYNITTEIGINSKGTRTGGTITPATATELDYKKLVETVKHQKDAINNIVITPSPNYVITSITLDGQPVEYSIGANGVVTLPALTNVTADHNYVVIFEDTIGQVLVHHYEQGTTTSVAPDEMLSGKIDDNYNTNPRLDLSEWELKKSVDGEYELPPNKQGQYSSKVEVVTYEYVKKQVPLTVYYYVEGTTDPVPLENGELAPTIEEKGNQGVDYTTYPLGTNELGSPSDKYELIEMPYNYKGEYDYAEVVVIYYYRVKDSAGVKVEHIDTNTRQKIAKDVYLPADGTGKYGDEYTTNVADDLPPNYKYVTKSSNWQGTMIDKLTTVTYEYDLTDSQIVDQNIEKTATENIEEPDDEVKYTIKYTAKVQNYIGKAQVLVVDTLPYTINEELSNLAGGTYEEGSRTITWKQIYDGIDTYTNGDYPVNFEKEITVVFNGIEKNQSIITNNVTGKLKLFTPEQESTPVEDNAETLLKRAIINIRKEKTIESERDYVVKGDIIEYKIIVTNSGNAGINGLIKDKIPEGTTFVDGSIRINNSTNYTLGEKQIDTTNLTKQDIENGIIVYLGKSEVDPTVTTVSFKVKVNEDAKEEIVNVATVKDLRSEEDISPDPEIPEIDPDVPIVEEQPSEEVKVPVVIFEKKAQIVRKASVEKTNEAQMQNQSVQEVQTQSAESQVAEAQQETQMKNQNVQEMQTQSTESQVSEAQQEEGKQILGENEVTVEDEITYIITITNKGSSEVHNIKVTDNVPEGTQFKESIDNPVVKEGKQIEWTIPSMQPGESKELSFTVIVKYAQLDGEIRNVALVSEKETNETVTNYKRPEITLTTNVQKTGMQNLTSAEEPIDYTIEYTATIRNFVGKAEVTIVDKLPYQIDVANSNFGDGKYSPENRTITWTEITEDIDTYRDLGPKVINKTKTISLKYIYTDVENLNGDIRNEVTATTDLKEPNPEKKNHPEDPEVPDEIVVKTEEKQDDHTVVAQIPAKIIVHHYFYDKETNQGTQIRLAKDYEEEGQIGQDYTTSKSEEVAKNYECMNEQPEKYKGKMTKTPTEIIYYYTLKDETITGEVIKTAEVEKIEDNELDESQDNELDESQEEQESEDTLSKQVLTNENGKITYDITYTAKITDYIGKAKITIVDVLPAPIDTVNSQLASGNYKPEDNTITWEETIEGINTYEDGLLTPDKPEDGKVTNGTFEKTIHKQIIIAYKGQNLVKPIENTARGITTTYYPDIHPSKPNEEKKTDTKEGKAIVEQDYRVDKIVEKIWDDNDNLKEHRPNSVNIQLTANGQNKWNGEDLPIVELSNDNNWTHTFTELEKYDSEGNLINYSIKEIEVNKGDLEYYAEPEIVITENKDVEIGEDEQDKTEQGETGTDSQGGDNSTEQENETNTNKKIAKNQVGKIIVTNPYRLTNTELESNITKEGSTQIIASAQEVNYTINYHAVVKDYIGEAIVTLTDTLPYAIDEDKSDLNGGKYNADLQTITWKDDIGHINTIESGNKIVDIQKNIKVVFTNLDEKVEKITNKVKGKIEFTESETKNEVETSYDTNVNIKGKIVVKYVDKETGEQIKQIVPPGKVGNETGESPVELTYDYEKEDKVGTQYERDQKEIYGYNFVEDSGNTQGEIVEGTTEVTYYYERKSSGGVTAKYVDEDGKEIADPEKIEGKVGDPYKTEDKKDELLDYELVETTGDAPEGRLEEDAKEVVYHYRKLTAKVIVKHLEKETNNQLAEEKVIEGKVGEQYQTSREIIKGYKGAEPEPENASGKMERNEQNNTIYVTYYYERIPSGKITVKYVDKETNEEIVQTIEPGQPGNEGGTENINKPYTEELQGYVGDKYTTKEKEIPYYEYLEELAPSNKEGIYEENDGTVIYYYRKLVFNFSIEKKIAEASIDGKQAKVDDDGKIIKLEVVAKKVATSKVEVKYELEVKNTGEIEGTANIKETLPAGFKVSNSNPSYWEEQTDGTLITEVKLNPGQSENLEVVAIWENGGNNFGTMRNQAQITDTNNPANFLDSNEDDNISTADVVMSIKTGAEQKVLGVALGTIATSGLLVLLYQFVLAFAFKKMRMFYKS